MPPEADTVKKCNDGKDNDGDGLIDFGDGPLNDPDCDFVGEDPGPGGGGGSGTYSLTFSGPLPGGSNGEMYNKLSANGVNFNTVHNDQKTTINLNWFAHFGDGGMGHGFGEGENCFGGGVGHDTSVMGELHTFKPFAVSVRQGRRGRAEASVVFRALTKDGAAAGYSLHTLGYFKDLPSGWPPSDSAKDAVVRMTSWDMVLGNGQDLEIVDVCLSVGDWSFANEWQITVSLD